MTRAVVGGRLDYSQFDSRDPISYLREQIILEEMNAMVYTDIWSLSAQVGDTASAWRRYIKYQMPWIDWDTGEDKTTSKKVKTREEQYDFPEFRQKVKELMDDGAPKDIAEEFAEFWMLKKESKTITE